MNKPPNAMTHYAINPKAKPYFSKVGQDQTPVLVMDDFLLNLDQALLQGVSEMTFDKYDTYYPGIRAVLPEDYIVTVTRAMMSIIKKMYGIPATYRAEFFTSYYSLVTHHAKELSLEQRIPHFDGTENYRFALIHYLNPAPHGGTAFYRHKQSGYERIEEARVDHYLTLLDDYMTSHGLPRAKYIDASDNQYEKIGEIPYAQNRLALYPGNLLHSGSIVPDYDIDNNPTTGRLTANVFLNFIP